MVRKLVITDFAEGSYEAVVKYLLSEWSVKEANSFIDRFHQVCDFLIKTPEIYPFINVSKRIQRCVLTKQNIIYFRDDNNEIVILDVFDTRQNPEKLNRIF